MADVIQETQSEFWRPAVLPGDPVTPQALPTRAEVCPGCGTEFLLGSGFCHSCGQVRPEAGSLLEDDAAEFAGLWARAVDRVRSLIARVPWNKIQWPQSLHYLHFHEIKSRIGLTTASLIAFLAGLGCVAGALLVSLLTVKTLVDWQAIQFYRAEWLLAATAAFVAGILLKKPNRSRD
jgi:hypothetical protein